jgi:endonuclease-3
MDLHSDSIEQWQALSSRGFGGAGGIPRRTPIGQLVKSLISSRTRDAVSLAAYRSLRERFGSAAGIAAAPVAAVETVIARVTFADVKAPRLVEALRRIEAEHPDFRLDHLGDPPVPQALAELETLPGVGRKTAASVLNFSTLDRPVLVVDSHVARVIGRLAGVPADPVRISEAVTTAMPHWPAPAFVAFHVQLKRLGQTLCSWDVPRCEGCPLSAACATNPRPAPVGIERWPRSRDR